MKILHIINGLKNGGAENTLYKICKYDNKNEHIVISLTKYGKYFLLLKKINIKVYCLDFKYYSIFNFFYIIKLIRLLKPDIVQTWLVHADFIGGIASKLAGINKIIWNIRYSNLDKGIIKLTTYFFIKILSLLSFVIPKKIVVVSKRGLKNCEDLGYCVSKLKLIHNGYEPFVFKNNNQKVDFRKKYKIKNNVAIIGSIARYDPTKDHENLFKALSIVKKKTNFICLLFGSNISKKNIILTNQLKKFQLSGSVRLLGSRINILQYAQSFDLHILSSLTEGFPNVVAETMTCGVPNIVTNVGDSSLIVGKTGWIVPAQNHVKLANTIQKALSKIGKDNWKKRCMDSRIRINKKFGMNKMIESYNLIWSKVYNSNK